MFLPVGTDAPLYHRPIGTISLIAANCITFYLTAGGADAAGWRLTFGNGLHPTEWLLSAFLHFGPMHLVGNMFFLWAFGLIVEGKIGFHRFVSLYMTMCLLEGFIDQVLMLGYDGSTRGAGGASGVIFGLMAIALLWAPENTIEIAWAHWWGFGLGRGGTFDVRVSSFALFYLLTNLFFAGLRGFSMSSELLHLIGAAVGAPFGLLFLKRGWVDCEGWDLVAVWRGEHRHRSEGGFQPGAWRAAASDRFLQKIEPSAQQLQRRIEEAIDERQYVSAASQYIDHRQRRRIKPLERDRLQTLIDGLVAQREWSSAAILLEEYVERYPSEAAPARLALAGILARNLSRPRAALRMLEDLERDNLTSEQRDLADRIQTLARQQVDTGLVELTATTSRLSH